MDGRIGSPKYFFFKFKPTPNFFKKWIYLTLQRQDSNFKVGKELRSKKADVLIIIYL